MGGFGSGMSWDSRITVEESLTLNTDELARKGLLTPTLYGELKWSQEGQKIAHINYSLQR